MAHIVPTVRIDSTVRAKDLDRLFSDRQFVTVVNTNRRVLGLASSDDMRAAVEAGGGEASPKAVLLLGVPLLRADSPATHAVAQLRASRVDILPVVDDQRRLIGAVSADQLELRDQPDDVEKGPGAFAEGLHALEREAQAGLVPGELRRWCGYVADRMTALTGAWARRQRDRFEMLDQLRDADAALHARADELGAAELELRDRFNALCADIERVKDAPESLRNERVDEIRTGVLHWIADLRAHDGDLTTWYNEALLRDRGVGD